MAVHPNAEVVRRYFDAVHRDPASAVELYDPDVVLHYSGGHRLSGDYRGPKAVLELFGQSRDAFRGTQALEVHDVVGGDEHAVALIDASAELHGRRRRWKRVVVFHVSRGRITEQWIIDAEQQLVDEIVGR